MVTAELLPLSSSKYEYGPPKFNAIEIGRLVDRGIRESKFIDFEKLCIKEGEKVWAVIIDIYSINDDGNLLDAAFIGALAALKSAKMPFYDEKKEKIDYEAESKKKIPLTKNIPINFSIHKIKNSFFLDPSIEEELASEGRIILAFIPDSPVKICSMQKGETMVVSTDEFNKAIKLAEDKYDSFFSEVMKKIDSEILKLK